MSVNSDFQSTLNHAAEADSDLLARITCRDFRHLKTWQVRQYRKAVDENKWYMSEKLGREVSWLEAERDFMEHEYYDCAQKWRSEYCTVRCIHSHDCPLGQLLSEMSIQQ